MPGFSRSRLKGLAVFLCLLGAELCTWAQGQLVFNNQVTHAIIAPVYGLESGSPYQFKQGNTAEGVPAGTQTYTGTLLTGKGFTAQLFGGPLNTPEAQLQALVPATTFLTGNAAGFVEAPGVAVTVPDVPTGERARIQLRVWDNRQGTITNWAQVLADPAIPRGQSPAFDSLPLGGLFVAPPNLEGLVSFNLSLEAPAPIRLRFDMPAGLPRMQFTGVPGGTYQVLASTNLLDWKIIGAAWPTNGHFEFQDSTVPIRPSRYYRVQSAKAP